MPPTGFLPLGIVRVAFGNFEHSENPVDGRADVVAHVPQEVGLGRCRRLSFPGGSDEFFLIVDFPLFFFGDVSGNREALHKASVFVVGLRDEHVSNPVSPAGRKNKVHVAEGTRRETRFHG